MDETQPLQPERRRFLGKAGAPLAAAALGPALFGMQARAEAAGASSSVVTLRSLRAAPVPAGFAMMAVAGHHKPGDGGGGLFYWDAEFLPPQFGNDPAVPAPHIVSNNVPDNGGTYLLPAGQPPARAGRWRRVSDGGAVNVRWFGALGDSSGRTPHDDGVDISDAPWNVWPKYLTADAGNNPTFFRFNTKAAPFANSDSWDWIGIQLALFSVGGTPSEVTIPGGFYLLSQTLFMAKGMHATLTGAGMCQTTLTKTPGRFNDSTLLSLYRIGGTPTTIRGINFSGQFGGGTRGFNLITQNNTNGVHLENCWFTTSQVGVYYVNNCTDSFVTNCTAEYCETVLNLDLDINYKHDSGSEVTVDGCNFWQTAHGPRYNGITVKGGILQCIGTRFMGFNGTSIGASIAERDGARIYPRLLVTGNHFLNFNCVSAALSGDGRGWAVTGNRFTGASGSCIARIPDQSTFSGNYVETTNSHACLNINQGARHTSVTGNTFINSSGMATFEGGLVISVKAGANYRSGCTQCVITGNSCGAVPSATGSGIQVDSSPASGNIIANNVVS